MIIDKFPEDMERRRIAELQRFFANHDTPSILREQGADGKKQTKTGGSRQRCGETKRKPRNLSNWLEATNSVPLGVGEEKLSNRWDDETTLNLLDAMMKFVSNNGYQPIGTHVDRWRIISSQVNNPRGLNSDQLARSCFVRFDNLRRYRNHRSSNSRAKKRGRYKGLTSDVVRTKLEEYMELVYGESANRASAGDTSPSKRKRMTSEEIHLIDDDEQISEDDKIAMNEQESTKNSEIHKETSADVVTTSQNRDVESKSKKTKIRGRNGKVEVSMKDAFDIGEEQKTEGTLRRIIFPRSEQDDESYSFETTNRGYFEPETNSFSLKINPGTDHESKLEDVTIVQVDLVENISPSRARTELIKKAKAR